MRVAHGHAAELTLDRVAMPEGRLDGADLTAAALSRCSMGRASARGARLRAACHLFYAVVAMVPS